MELRRLAPPAAVLAGLEVARGFGNKLQNNPIFRNEVKDNIGKNLTDFFRGRTEDLVFSLGLMTILWLIQEMTRDKEDTEQARRGRVTTTAAAGLVLGAYSMLEEFDKMSKGNGDWGDILIFSIPAVIGIAAVSRYVAMSKKAKE